MSKQATINEKLCKSCGFCIKVCPTGALYIGDALNKKGYHYVQIHSEKCVGCGSCYTVCPDNVFMIEEV